MTDLDSHDTAITVSAAGTDSSTAGHAHTKADPTHTAADLTHAAGLTPAAADPGHTAGGSDDAGRQHKSLLRRILDWLTAGYPSGVPPTERYALIALLKRTLTDEDIQQIITRLTAENSAALADSVITDEEIREMTARVLEQPPSDEDINKVSARLAAAGWPLQGVFVDRSNSER